MDKNVRASVAMAAYNGEKYIMEQLDSIIEMLGPSDEIVVSCDESSDRTWDIIRKYAKKDARIVCIKNKLKKGVCGNFSNAIKHCSGKYIFLCDQDDVWIDDKINRMIDVLEKSGADMAVHDGYITDSELNVSSKTFFNIGKINTSPIANFIQGRFWGCCMVFKCETMGYLIPFPDKIAHDIYATILVGIKGNITVVDDIFIKHRMHRTNVTPRVHGGIWRIGVDRIRLFFCVLERLARCSIQKIGS